MLIDKKKERTRSPYSHFEDPSQPISPRKNQSASIKRKKSSQFHHTAILGSSPPRGRYPGRSLERKWGKLTTQKKFIRIDEGFRKG